MPRNVRNFWIEAEVEGRKSKIAFGPQGKEDGFCLTVFMRNKGEVEAVLGLQGKVEGENVELWIDSGEVGEEGQEANQGIIIICRER